MLLRAFLRPDVGGWVDFESWYWNGCPYDGAGLPFGRVWTEDISWFFQLPLSIATVQEDVR